MLPALRPTISALRKDLPAWEWRVERYGFGGLRYHGTPVRADVEPVVVEAYSFIVDADLDVFETGWLVRFFLGHATATEAFGSFLLRNKAAREHG